MKKLLSVLFLLTGLLLPAPAQATVSCSVPFNLTNGTTADASQVMANYNAILACLSTSTAHSGANSDITSLSGLTTPISPSQGGTLFFAGGTSTGTNTVAIASTTPNSFTLTKNYCVSFVAGSTNTGAVTLNVGSTGATNLYRPSLSGPVALVGNELVAGQVGIACYDGTQYELFPLGTYASLANTDQTVTGGANVNPATNGNLGTLNSGTTTIDCGLVPLQYFTNNGIFTLAAPAHDGSCIILTTNGASANYPSFSGFTVGNNIGDTWSSCNGCQFLLSIVRVNGVATYFWKALQ